MTVSNVFGCGCGCGSSFECNVGGSNALLTQKMLGNSYQVVRFVAQNMEVLKDLSGTGIKEVADQLDTLLAIPAVVNASAEAAAASAVVSLTASGNAEGSKQAAQQAKTDAQQAKAGAEQALSIFKETWLGNHTSNPTVDLEGDPLSKGMIYFNTVTDQLMVYNGTAWILVTAASPSGIPDNKSVTDGKISDAYANVLTMHVASRTVLKDLDTSRYKAAYLTEVGREGLFSFRAGDYGTRITADTLEGVYVKATAVSASEGAWVRVYSGSANVKWFGAKGDDSAADLPSLQKATDVCKSVFIPNGTYKTDGPWLLDDYTTLNFESKAAEIKSTSASAIIRPRGHITSRNFFITIYSGTLRGTGTNGPVGIQLRSASMTKVYGTFITYCSAGVENGGAGSQSAYYNDFYGVDITTVITGYRNGTLGNEIKVFGGRITDMVIGTDDDDNSGVLYSGIAIETFTSAGHRLANSGFACVSIRSNACRFENPSGPTYASAVGVRIASTAQDTSIIAPQFLQMAAGNIIDGGIRTQVENTKKVTVNKAIASLATVTGRQEQFSIPGFAAGDTARVTLPAAWPSGLLCCGIISSSNQVYLQLWNPTGSAITLAAADFIFEWNDRT